MSIMKKKRKRKYKKKIHLTFRIMGIKKCLGHKYNRICNLKILIIRNSCLDNRIKKFKEAIHINMGKIHQGLQLNKVNQKIMILDLILISLKIKK